jgi:WD40 repeat protein
MPPTPAPDGWFTVEFNAAQTRLWQLNAARNAYEPVDATTEFRFGAANEIDLFMEAIASGGSALRLKHHAPGTKPVAKVDSLDIERFTVTGPRNVPGFCKYEYTDDLGTGKWMNSAHGTDVALARNKAEVLWNEGPAFGKVRYEASTDYTWAFNVAVVQVVLDLRARQRAQGSGLEYADQKTNGVTQDPFLQEREFLYLRSTVGRVNHPDLPASEQLPADQQQLDAPAMKAIVRVTSVKGPERMVDGQPKMFLDLITIRSSTYAVLAAITAMFAFGAAQGEERKPIAFPAGERFYGYVGPDVGLTVTHAEDRLSVWNLATGKVQLTIRGDFRSEGLNGDAFCATRAAFLVRHRIVVYSLEDGSRVAELASEDEDFQRIAIAPDGRSLAYKSPDFKLVSLPKGDVSAIIPSAGRHPDCENPRWEACLVFSPDGRLLVTSAAEEVRTTDVLTGRTVHLLEGHRTQVETAAFSGDGKRLATVSCDGRMIVWDVKAGKAIAEFQWPADRRTGGDGVGTLQLSHDGSRVLWAGFGTTCVWSVNDRALLKERPGFKGLHPCWFRLTPDAKRLIECGGTELLLWDLEKPTDKLLRSLGKGSWGELSPDTRWILCRPGEDPDSPQKLVPIDLSAGLIR